MGIVTGQTTDAGVGSVEALAVGQSVRLEADINLALEVASHHALPGTMTLAAKTRNVFGRQLAEPGWRGIEHSLKRVHEVSIRAQVTVLTRHSGFHRIESQLVVDYRVGGVATEAGLGFTRRQFSSHRFFYRVRCNPLLTHGDFEAVDGRVVAHKAVVESAFALQNPGLPTCSKAPANGHGDFIGTVRDSVGARVTHRFNYVGVRTPAEGHFRMRFECGICSGEFDCPTHGRSRLTDRLGCVAADASSGRAILPLLRLSACQHAGEPDQDRR